MRKIVLIIGISFLTAIGSLNAQSVGFSYFFPKHGYFSNPIAPINISLPVKVGNYFQVSPGIGMYNIGAMSMTGFADEFNSERPLVGPFQSLELTIIPAIVLPFKTFKIDFNGGAFGFFAFNQKLIKSEFDQMICEVYDYSAIGSNISMDKSGFGWGFIYGVKLSFKVAKNAWGYIGANYYNGAQIGDISGTYKALDSGNNIINGTFDITNKKILYHGLQLSVGAILK